ncbi:hypothetical protein AB1Y20_020707 [Prymnesium parvum]|uniref:Cell division cycle 5-like protein n=1 Tax=Prymnesium parvum TaxID=97485 RepID=A0AB34K070_PRYPA
MRILIKGGVWKNTEDEILKAAVMKYGKNQWSRISSLLVRKSAKQCKARWHEWLDPSIKKTEWSREEEEKLLHLAKLMPTQWRTIAPIIGRTAAQCLEHYERLLDQATRKDQELSATDDPRRLRPGEIDPNPESKPARPDPVDMDEDEKEMLSEARARLANTRGKKAKRKAREKQLEESRRLAALQKRRELKAAGIELGTRKGRSRGIDYNTEIPFQKVPPAGFFDVTGEDAAAEAAVNQGGDKFKSILKSRLDAPNRDAAEAKARKADAEKIKRRREEAMPEAIAQLNKLNDPMAVSKRAKLMLPPPQVGDRELEEVVKASASSLGLDDEGSDSTRLLINTYEQTPSHAAMRTPRVGGGGDTVLEEAAAQAAMLARHTPLQGGESLPLHSLGDFGGATPRPAASQTPNALSTARSPGATPLQRAAATPSRGSSAGGFTPRSEAGTAMSATPSRDALAINGEMDASLEGLPMNAQRRLQKERKMALMSQLSSLPAPQNEYKIVMPEMPPDDEAEEEPYEEDALDAAAREQAERERLHAAEMAKRSSALQAELPRPLVVNREMASAAGAENEADALVRDEMVKMLEADASTFPVKGAPEARKRKPLRPLPAERLEEARALLAAEVAAMEAEAPPPLAAAVAAAREAAAAAVVYVPARQGFAPLAECSGEEAVGAAQQQLQLVKNYMAKDAKKAAKMEKKLDVLLGGYKKRASALSAELQEKHQVLLDKLIELSCFKALQGHETIALPQRLSDMQALVEAQKQREAALQAKYSELSRTKRTLEEQAAARER